MGWEGDGGLMTGDEGLLKMLHRTNENSTCQQISISNTGLLLGTSDLSKQKH